MKKFFISFTVIFLAGFVAFAQDRPTPVKVYPKEIYDVLNNPGIGFTTFQRFNGDTLNAGIRWTEGFPIEYQTFDGDLTNKNHPQTTIAYFRIYWRFLEPEQGKYNWPIIDKALRTAAERGQTLMFRVAPYGTGNSTDVPSWYREMVGPKKQETVQNWVVDPEDPRYVQFFGGFIAAMGQRYNGHPDLESVDISIVGPWGEGEGSGLLSEQTRAALINSYLDNFKNTPLHILQCSPGTDPAKDPVNYLPDSDPRVQFKGTNIAATWPDGSNSGEGPQMRYIGYRFDCLGDYNRDRKIPNNFGRDADRDHMQDFYPREIIQIGLADAWKKTPITFEICWTFMHWLERFKWDEEIVSYIFGEALKWHISSFNAKSSPVPEVWSPLVDKWLNRMGYRFVVRQFIYPSYVYRQGQLSFTSLWENIGVAPIYKDYQLAVRLRNAQKTILLPTNANIRKWLPGDIVCDDKLYIPYNAPLGKYQLEIAIVAPASYEPRVQLAIEGKTNDGWYSIGEIEVREY